MRLCLQNLQVNPSKDFSNTKQQKVAAMEMVVSERIIVHSISFNDLVTIINRQSDLERCNYF